MTNVTLVGQSDPEVCGLCVRRQDATNMDAGCHPKLARTSYNQASPFTPSKGFLGSVFALRFTPGPEKYVSDHHGCCLEKRPASTLHPSVYLESRFLNLALLSVYVNPQPWDGLKGYATIYGRTRMTGTTLANFNGEGGCGGSFQTHAIGNHQKAPEAFHPVVMARTNVVNVARCVPPAL
jgi:hypothetical protein